MQFNVFSLVTLLSAASGALAQNTNALVVSYTRANCTGDATQVSYFVPNSYVQCALANATNTTSSQVLGQGCKTYFYFDDACKFNYFGGSSVVPDSKCYAHVGSFAVRC